MTEQPPLAKVAKVAAKKPKVNLRLDSAVWRPPPQPQACTLTHHAGGGGPAGRSAPQFTPIFSVLFLFFVWRGGECGGTDIRTENEPEGMGESLDGREQKRRLWCSRGPGGAWRGPVQQAGERESGGRHGRRAVLLNIPALPETTDSATQPQAPPHLSLHTPRATQAG